MSKELKTTFKHAGIYSIGVLVNRSVSFIMLPIYTRILTPSDYGILELLEITVDVVSIVTGLGILQGLFKFYHEYNGENEKKELISTLFLSIIVTYGCGCSLGALFSNLISSLIFSTEKYAFYVLISFINLFLSFLIYVPLAYARTQQKSVFFVILSLIKLAIQLSLNILLVVFLKFGVLGVLYSTMVSSLLIGGFLTIYTFLKVGFSFSKRKAIRLFKFGYPFVFSGFGAFIITYTDRYFLNYYHTVSNVGIYALGYKFGFLLAMFPVRPIFNIWMVQRFEIVKQKGYEIIFNRFLNWFVIIAMLVALAISLCVRDFFRIMSAPSFWEAYKIVPIILLAYFFQACTDFFNFGIHYKEKTKHMAYGTILAAVFILAFSFFLIPKYGAYGAAVATLISFIVRLVYIYFASQTEFTISYELGKPLGTLLICIFIYLIYIGGLKGFPSLINIYLSIGFVIFLFTSFLILLFTLNIINSEERRVLFSSITSPRQFFSKIRTKGI